MNPAISSVYHCNMWWTLLFLILAAATASDDENETQSCTSLIRGQCAGDDGAPNGLLSFEGDLEEYCKRATIYFDCVEKMVDICNENEEGHRFELKYLQDLASENKRICDEDSLLYSALDESLPCMKKNVDVLFSCPGFNEESLESLKDTLTRIGVTEFAAPDYEPELCLEMLYDFGCFAANAGKACNDVARDVVVDVAKGYDTLFEVCLPDLKENLHVIANVMQMEMEKEEAVENKIKKKK